MFALELMAMVIAAFAFGAWGVHSINNTTYRKATVTVSTPPAPEFKADLSPGYSVVEVDTDITTNIHKREVSVIGGVHPRSFTNYYYGDFSGYLAGAFDAREKLLVRNDGYYYVGNHLYGGDDWYMFVS